MGWGIPETPLVPGDSAYPGIPKRKIEGTYIKAIGKSVRHFKYDASEFNGTTATDHRLKVPPGYFWELIGGFLTRGVCTATATVTVYKPDNVSRRRLLVLASGASDTTDIPDDVARIRKDEILEEGASIRIVYGVAQNSDSEFNIDVLETEAK